MARASLFTNQRCQVYQLAKYKHVKTICEHNLDISPTAPSSSFFKLWSSKHGVETFYSYSTFWFASSQCLAMYFFAWPSMSFDHATVFACGFFPGIFQLLQIRDSKIFLNSSIIVLFGLHSRWVHPKSTWSRNDVGSPRSTNFIIFFHMGFRFCFLPAIFLSSTFSEKNKPCFRWTNRHSHFGNFPILVPRELFQIVFPTAVLEVGDHTDFV